MFKNKKQNKLISVFKIIIKPIKCRDTVTVGSSQSLFSCEKQSRAAVLISVRIIDHLVWMSDEAVGLLVSPDKLPYLKKERKEGPDLWI